MSSPLFFIGQDDINDLDDALPTDCRIDDLYCWHTLSLTPKDSYLSALSRLCAHWRQLIYEKVHCLLTFVFVSMLNTATRLVSFPRRIFENERNTSSASVLTLDSPKSSPRDLSAIDKSTMAHILVHQPAHRTSNIVIRQTNPQDNGSSLPMAHSVDETLFFYRPDSTSIFNFLQRFASEPHISKCHSASTRAYSYPLKHSFTITPSVVLKTADDDVAVVQKNEDQLDPHCDTLVLDNSTTSHASLNIERHFRRRKRRSSLTRLSNSQDDAEPVTDDADVKLDINNNSADISENSVLPPVESLSLVEEKEDSTPTVSRHRGRRLRQRFYRRPALESESRVDFYLPSTDESSSPPPSPSLPAKQPSPTRPIGSLKRAGTVSTGKKIVRFADSIGRELAQIQYIPSIRDGDSENGLYGSTSSNFELKPWSFDIGRPLSSTPPTKRFFCLYRQPNSEHADIYLHDVWRSQIKLEHADIRPKPSSPSGEQTLFGTLWVTNASYSKYVTVKYSFNHWVNTYEYEARHRCHSNDFRNIDQFEFNIDVPADVDRVDFVLRYCVNGQEHYDNNEGRNYTLQSECTSTPQTTISLPHDCDFNEMRFY